MKRLLVGVVIAGTAALLGGCPIYPDNGNYRVCSSYSCYDCPDPSYSGACVPWQCSSQNDCDSGFYCSGGSCIALTGSGLDAGASCASTPCQAGEQCKLANGALSCVPIAQQDSGSTTLADGGGDTGPIAVDGASTADAADATGIGTSDAQVVDATPAAPSCNADVDCGGAGARCIDGSCVSQSGLCSDATQCVVAGESCVDGLCVPHCSAAAPCPTGYACDFGRNVCSVNPAACSGSGTSTCQGGALCVESHCVAACAPSDSGPACPGGQVCVNGGCLPAQAAQFSCKNDGEDGQLANVCEVSSTCLHHDCYAACDLDGGGCAAGTSCKQVTVSAGTYAVCAGLTNLGSDCDPATGKSCSAGLLCIDGYCR